jgi:hypothetical protein
VGGASLQAESFVRIAGFVSAGPGR